MPRDPMAIFDSAARTRPPLGEPERLGGLEHISTVVPRAMAHLIARDAARRTPITPRPLGEEHGLTVHGPQS